MGCGALEWRLESAREICEGSVELQQHCLDSMKTFRLPTLKQLQGIFDTFLESKALSVKLANRDTVLTICCIGILSSAYKRGFSICVRSKCLRDNVEEVIRTFE